MATASQAPQIMTKADLAALIQLSARSVERLARTGKLPAPIVIGGSRRWRRSEVEAWLDRLAQEPQAK